MKLLRELNTEIENTELDQLELAELKSDMSPAEIISVIGLIAPILIKILQAWKLIPFTRSNERREKRNRRLDASIAALQMASVFSGGAKFIKH